MTKQTSTPVVEEITREQAVLMLTQGMGHRLFGLSFHKRTDPNEIREGSFRLSATMKKGKTGKGKAYKDTDKGLIGIYDTNKQAYRSVGIENIISIRTQGKEYVVKEKSEMFILVLALRSEGGEV